MSDAAMPNIHYIWWGPYNPEHNFESIKNVAQATVGASMVKVWCLQSERGQMQKALGGFINLKVIGLTHNLQGCKFDHGALNSLPKSAPHIGRIIAHLTAQKAYSAVKDLLMLLVLYIEGGFYLDTTTFMAPRSLVIRYRTLPGTNHLDDALMMIQKPFIARFPLIGKIRQYDPRPSTTPTLLLESAVSDSSIFTPDVDAWAAHAHAGDAMVGVMIDDYVAKCMKLGLVGGTTSGPLAVSQQRDSLIGDLIITAIQTGLNWYQTQHSMQVSDLAALMWPAADAGQEELKNLKGDFFCRFLGIIKKHKGSWRNALS